MINYNLSKEDVIGAKMSLEPVSFFTAKGTKGDLLLYPGGLEIEFLKSPELFLLRLKQ